MESCGPACSFVSVIWRCRARCREAMREKKRERSFIKRKKRCPTAVPVPWSDPCAVFRRAPCGRLPFFSRPFTSATGPEQRSARSSYGVCAFKSQDMGKYTKLRISASFIDVICLVALGADFPRARVTRLVPRWAPGAKVHKQQKIKKKKDVKTHLAQKERGIGIFLRMGRGAKNARIKKDGIRPWRRDSGKGDARGVLPAMMFPHETRRSS